MKKMMDRDISTYRRTIYYSFLIFLLLLPFQSHGGTYNQEYTRKELEHILNTQGVLCNSEKEFNPSFLPDSEKIISCAIVMAWIEHLPPDDSINKNNKLMKIEDAYIIPDKFVDEALCRYFGYKYNKSDNLEKSYYNKKFSTTFFSYRETGDADKRYNIKSISLLHNGILKAEGIITDYNDEPFSRFIAYFKNSNCDNKNNWILTKLIDLNIEM